MNAFKQRSVLQNATQADVLTEAFWIHPPQLRANGENRFSLRRKIERFLGLVVVKPVHSEPIIEKHRRIFCSVQNKSMEPPVQACGKRRIVLVKMHKIRRTFCTNRMASLSEPRGRSWSRMLFPRENQDRIPFFIAYRHAIRKRVFAGHPSDVHAHGFVAPRSSDIKRFVAKCSQHREKLALGLRASKLGNESNDSRHGWP